MSNDVENSRERQLARLLTLSLGPAEEWDESDVDFVLKVKGVDPAEAAGRLAASVEREIQSLKEQGNEVPAKLKTLRAGLLKDAKAIEALREGRKRIHDLFSVSAPLTANRRVHVFGRRVKQLSAHDQKILEDLAAELLNADEANGAT